MKENKNKGIFFVYISATLLVLFWLLLVMFGLSGNGISRYVSGLFRDAKQYLTVLGVLLITILVSGSILSRKAKIYSENSIISRVVHIGFWITICLAILAVILFIAAVIGMCVTGSFM